MMFAALRRLSTRAGSNTPRNLFLGLDCSTQGLKAVIVDGSDLSVVASTATSYENDFREYKLGSGGVCRSDGAVVTQPTLMYFHALDTVLSKLSSDKAPLHEVRAISGSGQQHGSVYWKTGAARVLTGLAPATPLKDQLQHAFSRPTSPIWMDSSTTAYCQQLEGFVGGPAAMATLTGSSAYERFTGPQIMKVATEQGTVYQNTERISLISSALASVLAGQYAPIDYSDGSGMNLLNITNKRWEPTIVNRISSDLENKLGAPQPSQHVYGTIHPYFTHKYGFAPSTSLVTWSGDNPCSVAGLGLSSVGDIGLSLGTSDTMFAIVKKPTPGVVGHVFVNPVDDASYMSMLCVKNGSLARERVKAEYAGNSWAQFNAALANTSPGNGGSVFVALFDPEITPRTSQPCVQRFNSAGDAVPEFESKDANVRGIVEGQFLSLRAHAEAIGLPTPSRIIATGGASSNHAILQVAADVFGATVYVCERTDSAALGAAYRACHGWLNANSGTEHVPFQAVFAKSSSPLVGVATSRNGPHSAYNALLPRFARLQKQAIARSSKQAQ